MLSRPRPSPWRPLSLATSTRAPRRLRLLFFLNHSWSFLAVTITILHSVGYVSPPRCILSPARPAPCVHDRRQDLCRRRYGTDNSPEGLAHSPDDTVRA